MATVREVTIKVDADLSALHDKLRLVELLRVADPEECTYFKRVWLETTGLPNRTVVVAGGVDVKVLSPEDAPPAE